MLKPYDDLTGEQKIKVTKMYSDLSTLRRFLYDFDDNGHYNGRQKALPSVIVEPEASKKAPPPEPKEIDPVKDAVQVVKPKRKRRTKKK